MSQPTRDLSICQRCSGKRIYRFRGPHETRKGQWVCGDCQSRRDNPASDPKRDMAICQRCSARRTYYASRKQWACIPCCRRYDAAKRAAHDAAVGPRIKRDLSICPKCQGPRVFYSSRTGGRGTWNCGSCKTAKQLAVRLAKAIAQGKTEREQYRAAISHNVARLRLAAEELAKKQREAEAALELEKIAARIEFRGVHNYYDLREAKRREWAEMAQRARRA